MREIFELPKLDKDNTVKRIDETKSFYLKDDSICRSTPSGAGEKMIDWADLPVDIQLYLLEELTSNSISKSEVDKRVLPINYKMKIVKKWFPEDMAPIIDQNKQIVTTSYNMDTITQKLSLIIEAGNDWLRESGGRKSISSNFGNNIKEISNDPVIERSLDIEKIRLLV